MLRSRRPVAQRAAEGTEEVEFIGMSVGTRSVEEMWDCAGRGREEAVGQGSGIGISAVMSRQSMNDVVLGPGRPGGLNQWPNSCEDVCLWPSVSPAD